MGWLKRAIKKTAELAVEAVDDCRDMAGDVVTTMSVRRRAKDDVELSLIRDDIWPGTPEWEREYPMRLSRELLAYGVLPDTDERGE